MGESVNAGNMGVPATPRDGADVEIIGLVKSTVRWLSKLHQGKQFPYAGVEGYTYKEWDTAVQTSFEKYFWVPEKVAEDKSHHIDPTVVHRRGIYKVRFAPVSTRSLSCLPRSNIDMPHITLKLLRAGCSTYPSPPVRLLSDRTRWVQARRLLITNFGRTFASP